MVFLWVFGNAVNYRLGHARFLGLYFLAALCSGMAHDLFYDVPVIGASGAIYAIVGAFLVYFPRNDVTVVWFFYLRPF